LFFCDVFKKMCWPFSASPKTQICQQHSREKVWMCSLLFIDDILWTRTSATLALKAEWSWESRLFQHLKDTSLNLKEWVKLFLMSVFASDVWTDFSTNITVKGANGNSWTCPFVASLRNTELLTAAGTEQIYQTETSCCDLCCDGSSLWCSGSDSGSNVSSWISCVVTLYNMFLKMISCLYVVVAYRRQLE